MDSYYWLEDYEVAELARQESDRYFRLAARAAAGEEVSLYALAVARNRMEATERMARERFRDY